MTTYRIAATLGRPLGRGRGRARDAVLADLAPYGVRLTPDAAGDVVRLEVPADGLEQAVRTGLALLAPHRAVGVEVVPAEVAERRASAAPMPELLSVTEVAERDGVTRQAVLSRIESGGLAAVRVGNAWVIPA